jgi:hypothetical protein
MLRRVSCLSRSSSWDSLFGGRRRSTAATTGSRSVLTDPLDSFRVLIDAAPEAVVPAPNVSHRCRSPWPRRQQPGGPPRPSLRPRSAPVLLRDLAPTSCSIPPPRAAAPRDAADGRSSRQTEDRADLDPPRDPPSDSCHVLRLKTWHAPFQPSTRSALSSPRHPCGHSMIRRRRLASPAARRPSPRW